MADSIGQVREDLEAIILRLKALEEADRPEYPLWVGSTMFEPQGTVIYVSTDGDDGNDGFTGASPVRSLAVGIAKLQSGGVLALRRGAVWGESFGDWKKNNVTICTYGWNPVRPLVESPTFGVVCHGSGGTPSVMENITFSGIAFTPMIRGAYNGVRWLQPTRGLKFIDCSFSGYEDNLVIQDYYSGGIENVEILDCVVMDAFSGRGKSQGLFAKAVNGMTIRGCVFDHNGWNRSGNAPPTIYSHNIYIQKDCRYVRIEDCIITRAASHGVQLRASESVLSDNLIVANPIGVLVGYDKVEKVSSNVFDNIILHALAHPEVMRGWGIEFRGNVLSINCHGNIVAWNDAVSANSRSIEDKMGVDYRGNYIFEWAPGREGNGWGETTPAQRVFVNTTKLTDLLTWEEFWRSTRSMVGGPEPNISPLSSLVSKIRDGFEPA